MAKPNIGVVVVTFNRLEMLKHALECYENQSYKPEFLLVVNNASTDGTDEFLKTWSSAESSIRKDVLNLSENIGGAGGFCEGMKRAVSEGVEWLFLADDDAFPEPDCLFYIAKGINNHPTAGAICSAVVNLGNVDISHRRRLRTTFFKCLLSTVPSNEYLDDFKMDIFSFVGTAISTRAIRNLGFPKSDYFIWHDDLEYSLRFLDKSDVYCCPRSRIYHDIKGSTEKYSWKHYYGLRNELDYLNVHFGKRYSVYRTVILFLSALKHYLKVEDRAYTKIILAAIKDYWSCNFGVSSVYYPGRKITS